MLQIALPSKEEYVLLVRMSPIQRTLYCKFMLSMSETSLQSWASNNPLKAFSVCCKVRGTIHLKAFLRAIRY